MPYIYTRDTVLWQEEDRINDTVFSSSDGRLVSMGAKRKEIYEDFSKGSLTNLSVRGRIFDAGTKSKGALTPGSTATSEIVTVNLNDFSNSNATNVPSGGYAQVPAHPSGLPFRWFQATAYPSILYTTRSSYIYVENDERAVFTFEYFSYLVQSADYVYVQALAADNSTVVATYTITSTVTKNRWQKGAIELPSGAYTIRIGQYNSTSAYQQLGIANMRVVKMKKRNVAATATYISKEYGIGATGTITSANITTTVHRPNGTPSIVPVFDSVSSSRNSWGMIASTNPTTMYKAFISGEHGLHGYWAPTLVASAGSPQYIAAYTLSSAETVRGYSLQVNGATYTPKDWRFEGGNDGSNWDILHTVTGESAWTNDEKRYYELPAAYTYKYFRVVFTLQHSTSSPLQLVHFGIHREIVPPSITAAYRYKNGAGAWSSWIPYSVTGSAVSIPGLAGLDMSDLVIQTRIDFYSTSLDSEMWVNSSKIVLNNSAGWFSTFETGENEVYEYEDMALRIDPTALVNYTSSATALTQIPLPIRAVRMDITEVGLDKIRCAVSFDNKSTWSVYRNGSWSNLLFKEQVHSLGMTASDLFRIPRSEWEARTATSPPQIVISILSELGNNGSYIRSLAFGSNDLHGFNVTKPGNGSKVNVLPLFGRIVSPLPATSTIVASRKTGVEKLYIANANQQYKPRYMSSIKSIGQPAEIYRGGVINGQYQVKALPVSIADNFAGISKSDPFMKRIVSPMVVTYEIGRKTAAPYGNGGERTITIIETEETVYQPRKWPLEWKPTVWNGQEKG